MALRIVSLVVIIVAGAGFTLIVALHFDEKIWTWLKALLLPAVIALIGTVGGAWFTRERAREAALQAYLDKMSEPLIDKKIHEEYGRYAVTRVTARAHVGSAQSIGWEAQENRSAVLARGTVDQQAVARSRGPENLPLHHWVKKRRLQRRSPARHPADQH
jgi:hypothetical protein